MSPARVLVAVLCLAALAGCPGSVAPGTACRSHDDCKGLTDGYCARAEVCTRECSSAKPCPDGAGCSNEGRRVCLANCTEDAGCPKGFACQASGDVTVCRLEAPLGTLPNQ